MPKTVLRIAIYVLGLMIACVGYAVLSFKPYAGFAIMASGMILEGIVLVSRKGKLTKIVGVLCFIAAVFIIAALVYMIANPPPLPPLPPDSQILILR